MSLIKCVHKGTLPSENVKPSNMNNNEGKYMGEGKVFNICEIRCFLLGKVHREYLIEVQE